MSRSSAAGCAHSARHVRGGLIEEAMLLEAGERVLRRRARARGGFRPPGPRGGASGFSPRSRSRSVCSGSKATGDLASGLASETRSRASSFRFPPPRRTCRPRCGRRALAGRCHDVARATSRKRKASRAWRRRPEETGWPDRRERPLSAKTHASRPGMARASPRGGGALVHSATPRASQRVLPVGATASGQGSRYARGSQPLAARAIPRCRSGGLSRREARRPRAGALFARADDRFDEPDPGRKTKPSIVPDSAAEILDDAALGRRLRDAA